VVPTTAGNRPFLPYRSMPCALVDRGAGLAANIPLLCTTKAMQAE
jgi:hypothetical protein